jgi:hypothetical protein
MLFCRHYFSPLNTFMRREGSGAGSLPLTNGSGSERPNNMWILRIRIRIPNTACHVWLLARDVTFHKKYTVRYSHKSFVFVRSCACLLVSKQRNHTIIIVKTFRIRTKRLVPPFIILLKVNVFPLCFCTYVRMCCHFSLT